MTEYELHQLILASRAEFDIASLAMLFASLGFIFVANQGAAMWSTLNRRLFVFSYVIVSSLILIRTIASIVRFGKLNLILQSGDPEFLVSNVTLQLPTALLRIGFFILMFWLTINIIKNISQVKD